MIIFILVKRRKKIAFCFIIRNNIFNQNIWKDFFKSLDIDFEILCHFKNKPKLIFDVKFVERIPTLWGTKSLVDATNILYRDAFYKYNCDVAYLLSGDSLPMYKNFKKYCEYNLRTTFKTLYNINDCELSRMKSQYDKLPKYLKTTKSLSFNKWKKTHMFFCVSRDDYIKIDDSRLLDNYFGHIEILDENYWCNAMTVLGLEYINDRNYIFSNNSYSSSQALVFNFEDDQTLYDRHTLKRSQIKTYSENISKSKIIRKIPYELKYGLKLFKKLNDD